MDYDLVIIGAGIAGAGVAQAAAAAGYKVLVLEAKEPGCATSCKSSKLIHGGLRYLETGQFSLVRESLHERALLLKLAPELVRLAPLHIPVYKHSKRSPVTIFTGLALYRALSLMDTNTRFHKLPQRQWHKLDGLRTDQLQAVFRYHEAQTDDRALTRAVLQSAISLGAELQTHARFSGAAIHPAGCELSYATHSAQGECSHNLSTRVVVNCAGPWAPQVNALISPKPALAEVDLIQGSHLLLEPLIKQHYYLESPSDGRAVFALPWQGKLLVGTTETEYRGDPAHAECLAREQQYLLNVIEHHFPDVTFSGTQIDTMAGLRVLPRSGKNAFNRSREVMLQTHRPERLRVLTLMGGKLTTYRATAERVINELKKDLPARPPRGDTRELMLYPC